MRRDPELAAYNDLVQRRDAAIAAEDPDLVKLNKQLESNYGDNYILVRDLNGAMHIRSVPNPYKALSYRESPDTDFNNPNGTNPMRAMNNQLIKDIIPKEILVDKAMTIAILESLWFCGQNHSVSDDPRCFPLRLLGELREFQSQQKQKEQAEKAVAILNNGNWTSLKLIMSALKGAIAGNPPFDIYNPPTASPVAPAPTVVPAIVPTVVPTVAPTIVPTTPLVTKLVKPVRRPRDITMEPLQTGLIGRHIVPLGGGRIRPLIPTSLGALPRYVRT